MAIAKWISFTQSVSPVSDAAPPKPVAAPSTADGKQFGLENFGNTCYANSVLQALYFCTPFRELVIQHTDPYAPPQNPSSSHFAPTHPPTSPTAAARRKPDRKSTQDPPTPNPVPHPPTSFTPTASRTLFSALRALYVHISQNPADKGTVAPRGFIEKLRELNECFRNTMHQDAHEFLNYLLNRIVEEIEEEKKQRLPSGDDLSRSMNSSSTTSHPPVMTASTSTSSTPSPGATFIHQIFEGTLTSETRCLTCENVSSRDESFLDLSIDIEQNSSVTACLRQFSASEMLCQKEKFFCDACCDLQEAERRMKIKRLPNVLALHLKRFKYQEDVQKHTKLTYRVAFPFQLRLFNTVDDIPNPDRLYELFAIVVHIGNGPNHGHYVSIIKTMGTWLIFDDESVDSIKEGDIPKYFGDSNSGSAYVLYYQALDIDLSALGLRAPSPEPVILPAPYSDPPQQWQPTESPVLVAQSALPPPPGLADDLTSAPVPEASPRPTTPQVPPQTSPQSPPDSPPKSPRKVSSTFLRALTIGPGSSRNGAVLRPSPSVLDEKLASSTKPSLSPLTIFPKEDLKPLEGKSAGVANGKETNGKELDSDKSVMGWFRRRSVRSVKPRSSSEVNADTPPLPQNVLTAPTSPVRNESTSSSSNSSKDSRHPLDSSTLGHRVPRVSPLLNGKPLPSSQSADPSYWETDSKQSSASSNSYTTPLSPPPSRRSQPRPLPPIPASPQTPKVETPSSSYSSASSRHIRTSQQYVIPTPNGFGSLSSPKLPGRPSTSAGTPTKNQPPPLTLSDNPRGPNSGATKGIPDSNNDTSLERPKSAHASYGPSLSPLVAQSSPPPVPVLPTGPNKKPSTRKLSLTAPRLSFGKRDKDKH